MFTGMLVGGATVVVADPGIDVLGEEVVEPDGTVVVGGVVVLDVDDDEEVVVSDWAIPFIS